MPEPLTSEEKIILAELAKRAGEGRLVTAKQLRDSGFAKFVFETCGKDVAYPDAQQSRVLQLLRDKGYILMRRGTYQIIAAPSSQTPASVGYEPKSGLENPKSELR